ncbi:MAG: cysteine desulfurase [Armatimonadetes bacterium]|nr:cysteine desulfurase [Armatimonadota bacterium]
MSRVYLDHAASSPLHPEARASMQAWLQDDLGNPSSLHQEGRRAKDAIDEARETLSGALGCLFAEVLFTSSGTEAANLAVIGTALIGIGGDRRRIMIGAAEHHCVLHTEATLRKLGYEVEFIPVDRSARVDLNWLQDNLTDDTLLVSVMHANNEIGSIQDLSPIADLARKHGAIFHSDAVQTFRQFDWTTPDLDPDLITLSAHKIGGPKGAGAIWIRAGVKIDPLAVGGGQEREMRAGTESVLQIVGFGAAVRHYEPKQEQRVALRERLMAGLERHGFVPTLPDRTECLAGHVHGRFPGLTAESALIRLDRLGISASSGAACSSGSVEPSHVMLAIGHDLTAAKEALRFTLGPSTTEAEIEQTLRAVAEMRG